MLRWFAMKYTKCLNKNLQKYLLEAYQDKLDVYLKKRLENDASIAVGIWNLYERNYLSQFEHKMKPDSFYLTLADEKTLFGNVTTNKQYPGTLERLNRCLGFLEKTWSGSSTQGVARGYRVTLKWLHELSEIERKTAYKKPRIPFGLTGSGITGKTTWKYMPNKHIKIDEADLQITWQHDSQKYNYYRRKYHREIKESGGYLCNAYQECPSGRVYSSIQNMPKIVREEFFAGWHEYDMKSAHFSILLSLNYELGLASKVPYIEQYVNDSSTIRHKVATEVGCDVRDVKTIFAAICYGANIRSPNSILRKKLGIEITRELANHEFIMTFDKEVRLLGKEVINNCTLSNAIVNVRRKRLIIKNNNFGAKLSHILQGLESVFLEAVLTAIGEREAVLIHDGFLIRRDLNPEKLSEIIEDKFGMDIRFSKKILVWSNSSGVASVPSGAFHTFAVTNTSYHTIASSEES